MSDDATQTADAPAPAETMSQPVESSPDPQPAAPQEQPQATQEPTAAPLQPQPLNQPPKADEPPKIDWESKDNPYRKRFSDIQPHASRLYNEVKPWRDLGLSPQQVQQMIAEQKQRESAANLKPWNAGHTDYKRFTQLKQVASDYRNALQAAGNDQQKQDFVKQLYANKFSDDDVKLMQEAERDRQDMLEAFQSDPRGFIAQHVTDVVQQHIQQFEQFQAAKATAHGWLTDPNNAPLIEKHRDDMLRMMDPEVPARQKAIEHAQLLAENEQLKAKLGESARETMQSSARQDLIHRRSAGTARRNTQQQEDVGDPVKHLIAKGLQPGSREFAVALTKLNSK